MSFGTMYTLHVFETRRNSTHVATRSGGTVIISSRSLLTMLEELCLTAYHTGSVMRYDESRLS